MNSGKLIVPSFKINDLSVIGTDPKELRHLKQEIFTQHSYYVELQTNQPTILDIGAHVGVTSLYFAHLYPKAEITAVEPHPVSFQLLTQNLTQNIISNVTAIQAAVIPESTQTTTTLYADPTSEWLSTASLLAGGWNHQQITQPITVPATTLSQLLATKPRWDLVKIDIEGAESEILLQPQPLLATVSHLVVEAHDWSDNFYQKLVAHLRQYKLLQAPETAIDHKLKLQIVEFTTDQD